MITQEYRRKIRVIFYYYKRLLSIPNYWSVRIGLSNKIPEYANVEYNYQEKRFTITINPKKNQDLETLKDSILHELIHVLLTPSTSRLEQLLQKIEHNKKINVKQVKHQMLEREEDLVDRLTKIIIKQEKTYNDKKPNA